MYGFPDVYSNLFYGARHVKYSDLQSSS
jgi:hypothetical protein